MNKKISSAFRYVLVGGVVFWLPAVVLASVLRSNISTAVLNSGGLAGLAALGIVNWRGRRESRRWGWSLAGIYILGPLSMLIVGALTSVGPSGGSHNEVWTLVFCLLPPVTLWFAILNGMIVSVLVATAALAILATNRRSISDT